MRNIGFKAALLALAAVLVLALAACSGDDEGDATEANTPPAQGTGGGASTGDVAEAADIPGQRVAYIDLVGAASGAQTIREAAEARAQDLGWTLEVSDAGGDVQRVANLIESAITQEVDAIVAVAVPVEAVSAQIQAAADAGIPYAAVNSGFDPNATFSQLTEEWAGASKAALYVANRLEGEGQVALVSSRVLATVTQREAAFRATLEAFPGIEIVARHEVDLTDLVGDSQRATNSILNGNPELDAIWTAFEDPGVGAQNALRQAGDDAPFLLSYAEGGPLLEAQAAGEIAGVLAFPLESHGNDSLNILSQYLAGEGREEGLAYYNDLTFLSDGQEYDEEEILNTPTYLIYSPDAE